MKTTQRGFIVPLLLIIAAILLAGGGAYFYTQTKSENPPVTENVTLPQATSTTQTSKAIPVPTITSIATSTDHDLVNIVISGSNFTNWATVEYLNNGKLVDSFCGYLGNNGTLTHSWGQPEGGWSFYSNVNQLRVVNADCRTADIKSGLSGYPSVTANISMVNNFPTFKSTQVTSPSGIAVTSPKPNELVTLPITVQGQISGNGWTANEGETGSVQVFDANGKAVSSVAILTATTDWLKLPTSFQSMVGDRQMMSSISTNTGYLKFTSKAEKNGQTQLMFTVPIRFK